MLLKLVKKINKKDFAFSNHNIMPHYARAHANTLKGFYADLYKL